MFYKKLNNELEICDYAQDWEIIINRDYSDSKIIPGSFVDWDNTPRNKHGVLYEGFTIEKFEKYMKRLVKRANKESKPIIFINAWNEWAEGAFLEPDETYGYQKLEAIKKALEAES